MTLSYYDPEKEELKQLEQDLKEANDKLREVASLIEGFLEYENQLDRRELEKFCRGFRR